MIDRLSALLVAAVLTTAAAPPRDRSFADALVAARAGADEPAELETLFRLQIAARRFADAETSLARLETLHGRVEPARAKALMPWRIYIRAMAYETGGLSSRDSLARAFADLIGPLSDRDLVETLRWYGANFDGLRDARARAAAACEGRAVDQCASAANLVAARQSLTTWTYLMPASQPLIRAELGRRFIVEDDLLIRTPDGAEIAAILIRPHDSGTARFASLLNFTIYARDDWAYADAARMAANGYAGIVAYSRGKGRSRGMPEPYVHDGADAVAVIEWLARQSWSDGRVAMWGGSYNAAAAWAAAGRRPPALRAIATNASNAPGIDSPMHDNVFQNFIYPWPLYTTDQRGLDEANYGDRARWAAVNRIWYTSGRPYRELERIDGHPNPVFATWLDHPSYDSYWRRLIPQGEDYARIDIPVLVQTGYYDGGMVGALHFLREHYRHRPNADHRLLVGPYHHTAMQTGVFANLNGYQVDEAARIDLQEIRMRWFDHVLRGAPLPGILSDRINFQVMGANSWRHVPSLDAMAPSRWRLFLTGERSDRGLSFAEAAPRRGRGPELSVDFRDRSDVDFNVPAEELDTRNALLFATAPVPAPMEVAGSFTGRFEIVVNKRDFDLSIGFFEQLADGSYFPLSSYLGRVSYMEDRSRRRLLTPDRPHTLRFESQWITARRLAAGSRLVALVGVPKHAGAQINYGTGRDVSDESIADAGEPLRVRFLPGSWLELKVRR